MCANMCVRMCACPQKSERVKWANVGMNDSTNEPNGRTEWWDSMDGWKLMPLFRNIDVNWRWTEWNTRGGRRVGGGEGWTYWRNDIQNKRPNNSLNKRVSDVNCILLAFLLRLFRFDPICSEKFDRPSAADTFTLLLGHYQKEKIFSAMK